jgi:hypothetical protein
MVGLPKYSPDPGKLIQKKGYFGSPLPDLWSGGGDRFPYFVAVPIGYGCVGYGPCKILEVLVLET